MTLKLSGRKHALAHRLGAALTFSTATCVMALSAAAFQTSGGLPNVEELRQQVAAARTTFGTGGIQIAADASGNVYVPYPAVNVVRKVSRDGAISIVAGTGTRGSNGDGRPAGSAQLFTPTAVVVDGSGNLYIADSGNSRVRKVSTDGVIRTIAGTDQAGNTGDGGPGTAAQLQTPYRLGLDAGGDLFIAEYARIRFLSAAGKIATFLHLAPPERATGDRQILASSSPGLRAMTTDAKGNVYAVLSPGTELIRITPNGDRKTLFGVTNTTAARSTSGPPLGGIPPQASAINAVAVDAAGNVYLSQPGLRRVVKLTPNGRVETIDQGNGSNFTVDNSSAPPLLSPTSIAVDASGNVYVTEHGRSGIRKIEPNGRISILAPTLDMPVSQNPVVPLDPVAAAIMNASSPGLPLGGAIDPLPAGRLEILNSRPTAITRPSMSQINFDLPNPLPQGFTTPSAISHPAPEVQFASVVRGSIEIEFLIDTSGRAVNINVIRGIDCTLDQLASETLLKWSFNPASQDGRVQAVRARIVMTYTNSPLSGRNGTRTSSAFNTIRGPAGLAVDRDGNLYAAFGGESIIRKIAPDGEVSTVAGIGTPGYSGNGAPALQAELNRPGGLAIDAKGVLYVADSENAQIRMISDKLITAGAGRGNRGFSGDFGRSLCAQLNRPAGVAIDSKGAIYIADSVNNRIRKAVPNGPIETVAGTAASGFSGDGEIAFKARLKNPTDIAIDAQGNIYIADSGNNRIRRIGADSVIETVAGSSTTAGFSGDKGPAKSAKLSKPSGIALDGAGNLYIADTGNNRIRKVQLASGTIETVVGNGKAGFAGDDGPAAGAAIKAPRAVAVSPNGDLFISDTGNNLVRKVKAGTAVITTVLGL